MTGQAPGVPRVVLPGDGADEEEDKAEVDDEDDGADDTQAAIELSGGALAPSSPAQPTAKADSTLVDMSTLNAQTFLVRPTRPDANRNRGKKAFKRRPPLSQAEKEARAKAQAEAGEGVPLPNISSASTKRVAVITEVDDEAAKAKADEDELVDEENVLLEELVEEMEHLQLSLEEAWFLSTALGVLRILDPVTVCSSLQALSAIAIQAFPVQATIHINRKDKTS